jgi:hypothetical protein
LKHPATAIIDYVWKNGFIAEEAALQRIKKRLTGTADDDYSGKRPGNRPCDHFSARIFTLYAGLMSTEAASGFDPLWNAQESWVSERTKALMPVMLPSIQ